MVGYGGNYVRCRICAFKGLPENHLIMSMLCPVYTATVSRLIQFNCQGAYAVMCEFGQAMRRRGARFALLQEPYFANGCVVLERRLAMSNGGR